MTRMLEHAMLPWLRHMMVGPFPNAIFYDAADREVVIHAVRHMAREPLEM